MDESTLTKTKDTAVRASVIFLRLAVLATISYVTYKGVISFNAKNEILQEERVKTACPTLLSVARTPRDTLLIMRSEEICIKYVLNSLQ